MDFEIPPFLVRNWKLQAFHNHSVTWNLEQTYDYLFKSQTGLRVPVFDSFQASLQFNYNRDNTPAQGANKDDYEYILTAGYTW